MLPRLRTAVTAGDPRIRAAATRARLVPDAEADQLLATTLRRDHDPTVRAAAIFAAGFRKLDPLVDAIAESAQHDPADYVRAGAVTLLARNRQLSPRIERALADVATNDPKPDLRRIAAGDARRTSRAAEAEFALTEKARAGDFFKFPCLLIAARSTTNSFNAY